MTFLIIGLGSMGKRRVRNLQVLKAGEIIGLELKEENRKEAEEKYGIKTFDNVDKINLEEIDAVIISTPPDKHNEWIDFAIERVERGSSLYQPLATNPAFPPIVGQMIRVGEETGKTDEVLERLAVYFESESEHLIRNLTTALEPVILVILGLGVGILVLSIILPIYNLTSQF